MDNLVGLVLNDRYQILAVIGKGGMAYVYKARDLKYDKLVAIKVLKSELLSQSRFKKRFLNESKAIALLSHKNIVNVYDVSFDDDIYYIVMEYIDGRTLKEYILDYAPLDEREALAYCGQVLNALKHAHERGVVHRDIKPHNIMLLNNGQIKVTDFGIAHVADFETLTVSENAIGSVHYLSPEQARGRTTDERSDLYSVGVMLYEMVTGRLPFDADNAVSVAIIQVQNEPELPSSIRPSISKGVESIIMKAMQKDVSLRYQHASEMIADIRLLLDNPDTTFDYSLTTKHNSFDDDFSSGTVEFSSVSNSSLGQVIEINRSEFDKYNSQDIKNVEVKKDISEQSEETEQQDESEPEEKETKSKKIKKRKLTDREVEVRRQKTYRNILFNRILVGSLGVILALAIVIMGSTIMFNVINNYANTIITVPNLVGQSLSDIQSNSFIKKNFELKIESKHDDTVGEGIVLEQDPENGNYVSGKELKLVVSAGPRMVNVPDIVNKPIQQALVILKENDLKAERITMSSSTVPEGNVIMCDPAVTTNVPVGTTIKVYVAVDTSVKQVKVPDVVGMEQQAAINKLYSHQLMPTVREGYNSIYPAGVVYGQSIVPDSEVNTNTEIILYVSLGPETEQPTTIQD